MEGRFHTTSCLILIWFLFIFSACLITSTSAKDEPTPNLNFTCERLNASCNECMKNVSCMWCNNPQKCILYPVKNILPSTKDCALSKARWGVCWLNFEALIISMSVIGGLLLITITLCCCKCCGCCCFNKSSAKFAREQERYERDRQERSMRQDERKKDRQRKNDDIRRKYGLIGDSNNYQKFENETA